MGTKQHENQAIGVRVATALRSRFPEAKQAEIAARLEMTPDAFSRSLSGERSFSTGELARAAHLFEADLHLLITGEPDPMRAVFAARHSFDPQTYEYSNEGRDDDRTIRDGVVLAYRQAQPWLSTATGVSLPTTPADVEALLGEGFARVFSDRVEERLGVDVVRLPGISTDYSISIGGQQIILLKTETNWFRSNWSLAHELGHLCLGHHEVDATHSHSAAELRANAFAAELLLPETMMRRQSWPDLDPEQVAQFIWDTGVSTATLRNRLNTLNIAVDREVAAWLTQSTPRFLNHFSLDDPASRPAVTPETFFATIHDPIGERMQKANDRRTPARLMKALRDGIADGALNTGTLAWLLGVDPHTLEVDEPDEPQDETEPSIESLLGL